METKDYTIITLSILLLASVGLNVMPEPNYKCDSRELKAFCFDLSESGKTCYTLPKYTGGKRCTEGWKDLNKVSEIVGIKWLCSPKPNYGCEGLI